MALVDSRMRSQISRWPHWWGWSVRGGLIEPGDGGEAASIRWLVDPLPHARSPRSVAGSRSAIVYVAAEGDLGALQGALAVVVGQLDQGGSP